LKKLAGISEPQLDRALEEVCVKGGFCTNLTGHSLLRKYESITAADFASSVLYAEGMGGHSNHRKYLENTFRKFCK